MSINRLYIYDPESNAALMIAKGYSTGWSMRSVPAQAEAFFDDYAPEYTAHIDATRLELRTENDLPEGCTVLYDNVVHVPAA